MAQAVKSDRHSLGVGSGDVFELAELFGLEHGRRVLFRRRHQIDSRLVAELDSAPAVWRVRARWLG